MKLRMLALGVLLLAGACGGRLDIKGNLNSSGTLSVLPSPTVGQAQACALAVQQAFADDANDISQAEGGSQLLNAWGGNSPTYGVYAGLRGLFVNDASQNGGQKALADILPMVQQGCRDAFP